MKCYWGPLCLSKLKQNETRLHHFYPARFNLSLIS